MKNKNKYIQSDVVDFVEIVAKLWKEKILIISIIFFFQVFVFIYASNQPRQFQTQITIRNAPSSLFERYRSFLDIQQQQKNIQQQQKKIDISDEFNSEFQLNLLSLDTLESFVKQNNEIKEFRLYLREENIPIRSFFKKKLLPLEIEKTNKIIPNQYSLVFQKPLMGDIFLNDYVVFVKKKTETMFKHNLKQTIYSKIAITNENLEIAKIIQLENPLLHRENYFIHDQDFFFHRGTKVLSQQIIFLKDLLETVDQLQLDYDPILEKASEPSVISKPIIPLLFLVLLASLFLSFVIIFLKSIKTKIV